MDIFGSNEQDNLRNDLITEIGEGIPVITVADKITITGTGGSGAYDITNIAEDTATFDLPTIQQTLNNHTAHVADLNNPHQVTKTQVGLSNVTNEAQLPLTGGEMTGNITFSGTQTVDGRDLSVDGTNLDNHIANLNNPHQVTKTQVGLSNVTNDAQLPLTGGEMTGNITFSSTQTVDGRDVSVDGTNLDNHIADGTIHFTQSSIDHTNILNVGTNTHAQIDAFISSKAQPNGLASLDGIGKVPSSQIPSIAITDVYVVASIAARDALTVQTGDVAKVTDAGLGEPETYIYDGTTWILLEDSDSVLSVNGQVKTVVLTTNDVSENINLYYTEARVSANSTVTGKLNKDGTDYMTGTLNIGDPVSLPLNAVINMRSSGNGPLAASQILMKDGIGLTKAELTSAGGSIRLYNHNPNNDIEIRNSTGTINNSIIIRDNLGTGEFVLVNNTNLKLGNALVQSGSIQDTTITHPDLTASQIVQTNGTKNLVSVAPLTAYNKNFGLISNTVLEGNRLDDGQISLQYLWSSQKIQNELNTGSNNLTAHLNDTTPHDLSQFLKDLTDDEVNQLKNIDSVSISNIQWGYVGNMNQGVNTNDTVTFNSINSTGDVNVKNPIFTPVVSSPVPNMLGYTGFNPSTQGNYSASYSSSTGQPAGQLFDGVLTNVVYCGAQYTNGIPNGTTNTTVSVNGDPTVISGEWFQLQNIVNKQRVSGLNWYSDSLRHPVDMVIAGSDDGINWVQMYKWVGLAFAVGVQATYYLDIGDEFSYSYIRLIPTLLRPGETLFGAREIEFTTATNNDNADVNVRGKTKIVTDVGTTALEVLGNVLVNSVVQDTNVSCFCRIEDNVSNNTLTIPNPSATHFNNVNAPNLQTFVISQNITTTPNSFRATILYDGYYRINAMTNFNLISPTSGVSIEFTYLRNGALARANWRRTFNDATENDLGGAILNDIDLFVAGDVITVVFYGSVNGTQIATNYSVMTLERLLNNV